MYINPFPPRHFAETHLLKLINYKSRTGLAFVPDAKMASEVQTCTQKTKFCNFTVLGFESFTALLPFLYGSNILEKTLRIVKLLSIEGSTGEKWDKIFIGIFLV